jgi:hypothetical protein
MSARRERLRRFRQRVEQVSRSARLHGSSGAPHDEQVALFIARPRRASPSRCSAERSSGRRRECPARPVAVGVRVDRHRSVRGGRAGVQRTSGATGPGCRGAKRGRRDSRGDGCGRLAGRAGGDGHGGTRRLESRPAHRCLTAPVWGCALDSPSEPPMGSGVLPQTSQEQGRAPLFPRLASRGAVQRGVCLNVKRSIFGGLGGREHESLADGPAPRRSSAADSGRFTHGSRLGGAIRPITRQFGQSISAIAK